MICQCDCCQYKIRQCVKCQNKNMSIKYEIRQCKRRQYDKLST